MTVQALSWQDLNEQLNKAWNARPTPKNKARYEELRLERARRNSLVQEKTTPKCATCQDRKTVYRSDVDMVVTCKACA